MKANSIMQEEKSENQSKIELSFFSIYISLIIKNTNHKADSILPPSDSISPEFLLVKYLGQKTTWRKRKKKHG